ncbi:uncharacterized protein LOC142974191 isoform X2 [Anticarsia gemmatalis]|uniref:uncharacterized protein LOC142974191 isoform X2 n=1 Tax=Anticarsia gemmatalis TaxID=129554 RepID=UPI003F775FD8
MAIIFHNEDMSPQSIEPRLEYRCTINITSNCSGEDKRARHCTGPKVGGGGGGGAGVLAQAVTHARQTSLVTSRPARRNYKTGRAAQPTAPASGAAQWRTRCRPTPTRHRRFTYRGRRHDAVHGAGRCAGAGTRARGERRYGARAQISADGCLRKQQQRGSSSEIKLRYTFRVRKARYVVTDLCHHQKLPYQKIETKFQRGQSAVVDKGSLTGLVRSAFTLSERSSVSFFPCPPKSRRVRFWTLLISLESNTKMSALIHEKIWLDKNIYNDAERNYYESLSKMDSVATLAGVPNTELTNKVNSLEKENTDLKKAIDDLRNLVISLQARVESLESTGSGAKTESSTAKAPPPAPAKVQDDDDDDGVDLFGSDDEEESAEAAKIREERLAAYNAKKAKKPVLIAKSNIILDVKPWDDETDMAALEKAVREIATDGLLWGAAKLVPLAYGIHKLQISCVVEDDKVSVDWLTEEIEKHEDFVQSVDIAAFNKV